jgi:hypothetical protein
LFTKYMGNPLMILSISHGDWRDNGCLDRGEYLGIKRAGTGRRSRREVGVMRGKGVRHGVISY